MWQYTAETIINSNDGKLKGGKRFILDGNHIIIDGVNAFDTTRIKEVYETGYKDESKDQATITIPSNITAGETILLKVVLFQQGLESSIYQNAYLKHRKPLFFEVEATSITTKPEEENAKNLAKVIKEQLASSDFKFFSVTVNGAVLTLDAIDCYTRIESVQLGTVGAAAGTGPALTGFNDFNILVELKFNDITHGNEGHGTVRQLVKNLRIPTSEATNPFGADPSGRPIPGGKYTQFLVEYTSDRRHVGNQVVGAMDTSITSHVFFIESAIVTDFENLFKNANITPKAVDVAPAQIAIKSTPGSVQ